MDNPPLLPFPVQVLHIIDEPCLGAAWPTRSGAPHPYRTNSILAKPPTTTGVWPLEACGRDSLVSTCFRLIEMFPELMDKCFIKYDQSGSRLAQQISIHYIVAKLRVWISRWSHSHTGVQESKISMLSGWEGWHDNQNTANQSWASVSWFRDCVRGQLAYSPIAQLPCDVAWETVQMDAVAGFMYLRGRAC